MCIFIGKILKLDLLKISIQKEFNFKEVKKFIEENPQAIVYIMVLTMNNYERIEKLCKYELEEMRRYVYKIISEFYDFYFQIQI
jgi:hypothetical protein